MLNARVVTFTFTVVHMIERLGSEGTGSFFKVGRRDRDSEA